MSNPINPNIQRSDQGSELFGDIDISDAGDGIDGLDEYRNNLDDKLAEIMAKWADAPYDAKEVNFSSEADSLASVLQNKITSEEQLRAAKQDLAMLQGLSRELANARSRGDYGRVAQIESQIQQLYAMRNPQGTSGTIGGGGAGGKGGVAPQQNPAVGFNKFPNGEGGYVTGHQTQVPMSPEQQLQELLSQANSNVSTYQGQLNSAVNSLPADWRGKSNSELNAAIQDMRYNNPAGYFARLRPELELNGNPNVMTLEELGKIKEFVQKTKERVTAVMAAMARVIGMVGDTLLGVARLQQ